MKTVLYSALITITALLSTGGTFHNVAEAAEKVSIREVRKLMKQTQKSCPQLDCDEARLRVESLSSAEYKSLGTALRNDLRTIARKMALDLWPDGILEGPYHSVFRMRMEKIQRLTLDGSPLGYRLTFSSKAWNTDNCLATLSTSDSESGSTDVDYKTCETGRIYDSGFVMENKTSFFRDESVNPFYVADAVDAIQTPLSEVSSLFTLTRASNSIGTRSISIPAEGIRCDKTSVEAKILSRLSMIEEYIDEERDLFICDDQERSPRCYEESALMTLMTSLIPDKNSSSNRYTTDPGYEICNHGSECRIQFAITCDASYLSIEEI